MSYRTISDKNKSVGTLSPLYGFIDWFFWKSSFPSSPPPINVVFSPQRYFPVKQHCLVVGGGGGGGEAGGVSRDAKAQVLCMCQMREKWQFVARCSKDFCRNCSYLRWQVVLLILHKSRTWRHAGNWSAALLDLSRYGYILCFNRTPAGDLLCSGGTWAAYIYTTLF